MFVTIEYQILYIKAICKSRNGESGYGMRGMIGMRGIRVGMWGIRVGMRGIGGENDGNQGGNFRVGVEMINKKCGEG